MLLVIDFSNPYNRVAHLLEGSPISIIGIELEDEKLFAEPEVEGLNQKQPIETSRAYDSLLSLFDRLSKYTQTLETESNSVTVRFHMNQITGALVISSNSELGESITESLRGNLQNTQCISNGISAEFGFNSECRVFDYILDVDAIHLSVNVESPAVHLHLGDRNDYILPSIQSSNNTLSNLDPQTIRINGAGLARNISRDIKANSSFQIWTTELINSPLGGKAGVDDKRFLLATELADKKTVFHRFEKGQRVENFSLPDYESRILFESQFLEVRRLLAKISASLPITEIILSAAALRSHLPDLSGLIATITNIPVYTLETEVEDHLLSGAFQHIRMELAKVGNFNLVDGIVPSSAIVLVSEPDSIFSKYYSGIMTEYERIQNLLEKGLI